MRDEYCRCKHGHAFAAQMWFTSVNRADRLDSILTLVNSAAVKEQRLSTAISMLQIQRQYDETHDTCVRKAGEPITQQLRNLKNGVEQWKQHEDDEIEYERDMYK